MSEVQQALARLAAQERIQPRLWLALRAATAFMAPLLLGAAGMVHPFPALIASFSAHSITMQDVRGHYGLRFRILLFQTLVVAGAVGLAAATGGGPILAILAAGLIAMGAGFLRHMLPEYGPGMAAASAMLFFTTLAAPHAIGPTQGLGLVLASVLGSLWGTLLVVMAWPIAPQHPLRAALGESWQALADFCDAMEARPVTELAQRHQEMAARELALDQIQARTQKVLDGAGHPRQRPLLPAFILLNRRAGGMADRLSALDQLLVAEGADPGVEEAFHTLLHALSNTSRSIAMALVSRRMDQTERAALRLARASSLLEVLRTRLEGKLQAPASDHAVDLLRSLDGFLMDLPPILRSTLGDKAPVEMPSLELADLHVPAPSPLERAFNLNHGMGRDLFRFSLRLSVAMAIGTAIFKSFHQPHGFWIPFSTLVVLQPDFGATWNRALHRAIGTLLGGLAVSALVWLQLPSWGLLSLTALLCGAFTYYVRRHYGTGIFLLTMLVILQLEATGPISLALTLERLACCVLGSLLAVLAAWRLWPVWEEQRIRPLLSEAMKATGAYFACLLESLGRGEPHPSRQLLRLKLQAELAHGRAFAGLGRMSKEPAEHRTQLATIAILANGSLRLTHILNSMLARLGQEAPPAPALKLDRFGGCAAKILETLATRLEGKAEPGKPCQALCEWRQTPLQASGPDAWLSARLGHAAVELEGLRLRVEEMTGNTEQPSTPEPSHQQEADPHKA